MVVFEGIQYPTRDIMVVIDGEKCEYTVATLELEYALMDDESFYIQYKSDEARAIDESIYYYCDEYEWNMSDEELGKYLSK